MARKAQVRGIGGYVPDKVLSNADLAQIMDTSDEWIVARSGIHQRHQADDTVMASDLGVIAAQNALANAGMSIADIDLIVVATSTPDFAFPATAAYVQQKLGSSHGAAFDVQAACSGTVTANLSATDNAVLDAIAADGDAIQTLITSTNSKIDTLDAQIDLLEGSNTIKDVDIQFELLPINSNLPDYNKKGMLEINDLI